MPAAWSGRDNAVLLDLEGHGREEIFTDIDLSRTVGWFTSLFPVRLDPGALDLDEALAGGAGAWAARSSASRNSCARCRTTGLAMALLRYLNPQTAAQLSGLAAPQIGFNYLGRFAVGQRRMDWAHAAEAVSSGGGDPAMPLAHALEVNALTLDARDGQASGPPGRGRPRC